MFHVGKLLFHLDSKNFVSAGMRFMRVRVLFQCLICAALYILKAQQLSKCSRIIVCFRFYQTSLNTQSFSTDVWCAKSRLCEEVSGVHGAVKLWRKCILRSFQTKQVWTCFLVLNNDWFL